MAIDMTRAVLEAVPLIQEFHKRFTYDPDTGLLWYRDDYRCSGLTAAARSKPAGTFDRHGYGKVGVCQQVIGLHRVIWMMMYGAIPDGYTIDHRDRNPSNNRLDNLRLATRAEQQQNRSRVSSGFPRGVRARRGRWVGTVKANGETFNAGSFDTMEQAEEAVIELRTLLHGEFAFTED